jgi:hypothetical protein
VQPIVQSGEDGRRTLLTDGKAGRRVFAADVGLDGVVVADEGHAFLGNRCGTGPVRVISMSLRRA